VEFSARGIHHVARCEVSLRTRMEIDEAPPAADKASRFRGSGTIGAPEGRGNRNAATVTVLRDELNLFAAGGRQKLRRCANAHVVRKKRSKLFAAGRRQSLRR